jgi:hypothetical protein
MGVHEIAGGPKLGGWLEVWPRAAMEDAVAARPTIPLKIGDRVIGEANLSVDDTGLKIEAEVDLSFSFRAKDQQWERDSEYPGDEYARRVISGLTIESMELSTGEETNMTDYYVGQSWVNDIDLNGVKTLSALELIVRDLKTALEAQPGIDPCGPVELWGNTEQNSTGFFMGDTTALHDEGWYRITPILGGVGVPDGRRSSCDGDERC